MTTMIRVVLTIDQANQLMRPVRGKGGWQSLLRRLQARLSGVVLTLDHRDIRQVRKYRSSYGGGGWQSRLSFWTDTPIDIAA